jgi:hypothetical protein
MYAMCRRPAHSMRGDYSTMELREMREGTSTGGRRLSGSLGGSRGYGHASGGCKAVLMPPARTQVVQKHTIRAALLSAFPSGVHGPCYGQKLYGQAIWTKAHGKGYMKSCSTLICDRAAGGLMLDDESGLVYSRASASTSGGGAKAAGAAWPTLTGYLDPETRALVKVRLWCLLLL